MSGCNRYKYVKITPSKSFFSEEIVKKASSLNLELPFDDNIMFVEKIEGNKVYFYFAPYSYHLTLLKNNITSFRVATVSGLLKLEEGYLITIQSRKKRYALSHTQYFPSFGGLVDDKGRDYICDSLYKEMKEELNVERKSIKSLKPLNVFLLPNFYCFTYIVEVGISFDELKSIQAGAVDSWEIDKMYLFSKKDIKKLNYKNSYPLLVKMAEAIE